MADRRITFNEAVALYRDRFGVDPGEATGAVWQAIASREIRPAWTEAAILEQERKAPRADANSWNIRFALNKRSAHDRAMARLRLLTEVESAAFTDQIIAGNIVLTEADLLSWYERERLPAPTSAEVMLRYRAGLNGANPSMKKAVEFAEKHGVKREQARIAYRDLFLSPEPGRPRK